LIDDSFSRYSAAVLALNFIGNRSASMVRALSRDLNTVQIESPTVLKSPIKWLSRAEFAHHCSVLAELAFWRLTAASDVCRRLSFLS